MFFVKYLLALHAKSIFDLLDKEIERETEDTKEKARGIYEIES